MDKLIFENEAQAGFYAADTAATLLRAKPKAVFCLAAGHTSLPVFDAIIKRNLDFSQARFVELDEWLDLSPEESGSCRRFMTENFFSRINARAENICLFDSVSGDPGAECGRVREQIARWGGIDYLLLGIGMNGHLALNEPGDDFNRGVHTVTLSETTRRVAPKYFPAGMPPITAGITLGIADILAARRIQLAIFGSHKADLARRLLAYTAPDPDFPASALLMSEAVELLLDKAATPPGA
jgi:6-phosphogluconolactonase/glucosamine-6-phosphate isomerase/deaminase